MRDFNNDGQININGDFNLADNSQNEHKLYINCSIEELRADRPFRAENIKIEQRKKINRLMPLYGMALILVFVAAIWAMLQGKSDLVTILVGGAGVFIGYKSLEATFEPNSFQTEEQDAVYEITKILKQRRAE